MKKLTRSQIKELAASKFGEIYSLGAQSDGFLVGFQAAQNHFNIPGPNKVVHTIHRFHVAIVYTRNDGKATTTTLKCGIYEGFNADEALGKCIYFYQKEMKNHNMMLHHSCQITELTGAIPLTR